MKTVTYDETKWQLVPKEADIAMLDAGHKQWVKGYEGFTLIAFVWKHMTNKAPAYPEENT